LKDRTGKARWGVGIRVVGVYSATEDLGIVAAVWRGSPLEVAHVAQQQIHVIFSALCKSLLFK
jgi:hypothetical protein